MSIHTRFQVSFRRFALPLLVLGGVGVAAVIVYASGGAVSVISTNPVSSQGSGFFRFEPSSSVNSSWVTSWAEIQTGQVFTTASYTSAWNGSAWSAPTTHTLTANADPTGDLFLTTDSQGRHVLVGLDALATRNGVPNPSVLQLFYKTSIDSSGQSWNAPVMPGLQVDYPSVAVASNGTIGIAFNQINSLGDVIGFQSTFSINGGATWSTPVNVTSSQSIRDGRIVAVGNTFYVLIADLTNTVPHNPNPAAHIQRYQWNGSTWSLIETSFQYTPPGLNSPQQVCNSTPGNPNNGHCGFIHYSTLIDAQGSSGGWVVLWAASRADNPQVNNFIVCSQNLSTNCTSMNYPTDLLVGGVATSQNGDMWISTLTYSGDPGTPQSPNRTLPLQQIAAYGTSGLSFVTGTPISPPTYILDPTSWAFFADSSAGSNRCAMGIVTQNCFSSGDYTRIAMNSFTGASLPFLNILFQTTNTLDQVFVQDPGTGLRPVNGLTFSRIPAGADLTFKGALSDAEIARRITTPHSRLLP